MEDLTSLSTTIDTDTGPSAAGGGQIPLPADDAKPASVRDDIAAVFKSDDRRQADERRAEKRAEVPAKAEAKADQAKEPDVKDGKPANAADPAQTDDKAGGKADPEEASPDEEAAKQDRQDEKREQEEKRERRHVEPPAKFMPRAKELWRNTPREVQQEVERISREYDGEIEKVRTVTQRYESLREFDDLAKSNGRDLRDSLVTLHRIENQMQRNPIAALNDILREIGPKKADGQSVSLFEVAQHIVSQGPQAYHQTMQQAQQQEQAQQPNQEVEAMRHQMAQLQQQILRDNVIQPFRAAHPRFDELEPYIASFLNSDMVPKTLGHAERLAAAYQMAERIYSPSDAPGEKHDPANDRAGEALSDHPRRADADFSGSKSIKSAHGAVSDEDSDEQAASKESIRDSILKAGRGLRR